MQVPSDRPYHTVATGTQQGNGLARFVEARVIHDTIGLFSQGDITDRPCPAITIGVNSINSYHYKVEQGTEKRKFTIAELRRICAFPDDFILTGSYAQQWERLGNSVPPVMMYHISDKIKREILDKAAVPA
jgi:site-specific DNA-cytosine methylase